VAAVTITPDDLSPFADIDPVKVELMIEDAMAMAARVAPCILDPEFEHDAAARAILRGAILRWNDSGTGALTQQGAGPFQVSYDTRQSRRTLFWPSEIAALQALCDDGSTGAFTIDTTPAAAQTGFWSGPDTWEPLA
jgi:hypothetical protein